MPTFDTLRGKAVGNEEELDDELALLDEELFEELEVVVTLDVVLGITFCVADTEEPEGEAPLKVLNVIVESPENIFPLVLFLA